MTKKELLQKIYDRMSTHLSKMSLSELREYVDDWFGEASGTQKSRIDLVDEFMMDYMRWREDESVEELTEILNNL